MSDDAREVGGGDAELGGVEADVVMLNEVLGQQTEETEEYLLYALGEAVFTDTVLLNGREVEQEETVEHLETFV